MARWLAVGLSSLFATADGAQLLESGAVERVQRGAVHCERGFAPPALVSDLRADMDALAHAGLFSAAGSGGRSGYEDTLRSAEYCDPVGRLERSLGDFEAFFCLWERLDAVRQHLAMEMGCPFLPEMELHYVRYPPGGFFGRHVDDYESSTTAAQPAGQVDAAGQGGRRAVSFICYLTPPDAPWQEADGGQLRAFRVASDQNDEDGEEVWDDFSPDSGALVLFDSCRVEHEVLPTTKTRDCLIGWFHVTQSTPLSALRGGWIPSSAIHTSADVVTSRPPADATMRSLRCVNAGGPIVSRADTSRSLRGLRCPNELVLRRASSLLMEDKSQPLTSESAAEMLEMTFVHACMALASGDVTTLKLFIAAAVGACRLGVSHPELIRILGECTSNTANRPLMPEELELRHTWISLVYLTLQIVEGKEEGASHPGQTVSTAERKELLPFTEAVVLRVGEGATLQSLSIEDIAPTPIDEPRTPMQTAILKQNMRLVFLTLMVLQEEAEAAGKTVARPFIPGTGPKRGDGLSAW
eukprot:scaffold71430_cov31-Tisochrysis_lutea.AAC.2